MSNNHQAGDGFELTNQCIASIWVAQHHGLGLYRISKAAMILSDQTSARPVWQFLLKRVPCQHQFNLRLNERTEQKGCSAFMSPASPLLNRTLVNSAWPSAGR
jgi:hypothetical protein